MKTTDELPESPDMTRGEALVAWMMLQGIFSHDAVKYGWWGLWNNAKLPFPMLLLDQVGREEGWEHGAYVKKKLYKPRLRFNFHGRARKAYKEFPELFLTYDYEKYRLAGAGFITENSSDDNLTIKTEHGKARYSRLELTIIPESYRHYAALYYREEYEGAFAD